MPSSATNPTWLLTGGAGFIGSNLVRLILGQRPDVHLVVLDKLTYAGSLENLRGLPRDAKLTFIEADIASAEAVRDVFARHRPCCVLNLAAESHVDRSIDEPAAFIETNIRGTFELLEASRNLVTHDAPAEREAFRFLQVSTDEVYGSLGPTGHFTEETPYAPNSPYSASKASADLLVRAYHRTYGLPTIITNCSNNYGPYQLPEKLIPLMALNALEAKPLPIYGDGGNVRDWIFVEDHCVGILRALETGRVGEQYAFGGEAERSNLQVVQGICEILERLSPAAKNAALRSADVSSYEELISFVEDRPGHDRRYAIDSAKATRELDWRPEREFESGLEQTISWYLENEAWRAAIQAEGDLRDRRGLSTASQGPSSQAPTGGQT